MTDEQAGQIAHGLIHGFIGADHKVTDLRIFYRALAQALQAAHQQGWEERAEADSPEMH
jgi:hypothetical protein